MANNGHRWKACQILSQHQWHLVLDTKSGKFGHNIRKIKEVSWKAEKHLQWYKLVSRNKKNLKQPKLTPKATREKKEKFKVSRRQEIVMIRAEINEDKENNRKDQWSYKLVL